MSRIKAKKFVERWKNRGDEESDTYKFWEELFKDVLDYEVDSSTIDTQKKVITPRSTHPGKIDIWIPHTKVLIEQKSLGIDLDKAGIRQGVKVTPLEQALGYFEGFAVGYRPNFIVTCNFNEMRVYDTRRHDTLHHNPDPDLKIHLDDIPNNISNLMFLVKDQDTELIETKDVSIEAGRIMAKIHDAVAKEFPDPNTEEAHHALSVFCTRIMFLMYCEDAGLIGTRAFTDYIDHYKDENDTRDAILSLFKWLDTPETDRDPFANDLLKRFPYMNGGLFKEQIFIPQIKNEVREIILNYGCIGFDWSEVDPTVFGSIFEGALSHDQRRDGGMHYTSPSNIHKVIDPLFLDDLNSEFEAIKKKPKGGAGLKV